MRFECRQPARTDLTFQLVTKLIENRLALTHDCPAELGDHEALAAGVVGFTSRSMYPRSSRTAIVFAVGPVLAVGAGGGPFTATTVQQVTTGDITSVRLEGVGHYAALEAPAALSTAILEFLDSVDAT